MVSEWELWQTDGISNGEEYDANDAYNEQDYHESRNDDITADYVDDKDYDDCDGDEENEGDDDINIHQGNKQRGFHRCCSAWESEQPWAAGSF